MKKLKLHIFRTVIAALVLLGFIAQLITPLSADAKKVAFTKWLSHSVISTSDGHQSQLRQTIQELQSKSQDFHLLLEQATQLLLNHQDIVTLPGKTSGEKQQFTHWLVGQWNLFQFQKSGANAVLPEMSNPVYKWLTQHHNPALISTKPVFNQFGAVYTALRNQNRILCFSLRPLIDQISINAP